MRTLVVTPTYNEAETLPGVVQRILASVPSADVLVVDDGSPDGTGALADAMSVEDARVHVLHRLAKNGLGAAYLAGFAWGLQRDYDVLVEMDADGSHQPEELGRLLEAVGDGADLVLGARWVDGGAVRNWPLRRQLLSRGGNLYVRMALGLHLRDATAGYRAFRAETLRRIDLEEVASRGYTFQIDLARRTVRAGLDVREVPITFVEREAGVSKMTGDIVREAVWRVAVWGARDRTRWLRGVVSNRERTREV
ncbi:dolichol-phosphate mannosyltransferase [Mumia flava]|uniref:Dolichol-phosphate mannosyltransferase n=1 Tax=Mumia flava TaxID=1348852 RepID=A0A0B2B4F5_9ACTN|nr:polyprenol monophosphomannose synthase [Mumia flava]PJJ53478.1 dolichol-phosphate mannosyltransferase [Mumia flava]